MVGYYGEQPKPSGAGCTQHDIRRDRQFAKTKFDRYFPKAYSAQSALAAANLVTRRFGQVGVARKPP
jgi:hypothetical protein